MSRKDYTLMLLIVVVIIGILAAIAIPKFVQTKGGTSVRAMKSDMSIATSNPILAGTGEGEPACAA